MIYNTDKIDIIGKHKDGGVNLFIVSTGILPATVETQNLILDKIENYLSYINSSDFKKEFGKLKQEQIRIIFKYDTKPDELIFKLFVKIKEWVLKSGAVIIFTDE